MESARRRVFIVATCGPELAQRTPAPFLFAQQAAAQGHQVSICFVLQAPLLLKRDLIETVRARDDGKTMRQWVDETLAAGVTFFVCDAALVLCEMTADDLIDEVDNLVGPSFLITQGLASDLVLSF
jgi:predicted peroxiredoxin